jgi:hypothetical protein
MPERQYVKEAAFRLVVHEVADATEKQAAHTWRSCPFVLGAYAWLLSK